MTNSRLIEILLMVIDRLERDKVLKAHMVYASGICGHISRLQMHDAITMDEKLASKAFVLANKPNKDRYTKYVEGKYWTGNTFWWTPISQERATAQIRINFLKELIKTI